MGVAGAVAGTFGIQPLVGAFGVPYQAAEPRDERQIRVPLRNSPPNVTVRVAISGLRVGGGRRAVVGRWSQTDK